MTSIELTLITGSITIPYLIYACDVYGNNCVLIANILTTVPPTNTIFLPPQFNTAPAVGIKIITNDGCERFEIFNCNELLISPTPTPTYTPTPTPTKTVTPTPTGTNGAVTPTPTPTNTNTPTNTVTPTPTNTQTPTNTTTPTPTGTNSPIIIESPTPTPTNTVTPTNTMTNTPTPTPTSTGSPVAQCLNYRVSSPFSEADGTGFSFNGCCANNGETSINIMRGDEDFICSTTVPLITYGFSGAADLQGACPTCN
jgi:hypothetical protein